MTFSMTASGHIRRVSYANSSLHVLGAARKAQAAIEIGPGRDRFRIAATRSWRNGQLLLHQIVFLQVVGVSRIGGRFNAALVIAGGNIGHGD